MIVVGLSPVLVTQQTLQLLSVKSVDNDWEAIHVDNVNEDAFL